MKYEMIDLESFFNADLSYEKNAVLGAVGIITASQMVIRLNEADVTSDDKMVKGAGDHNEERIMILSDIFDLPKDLYDGIHYYNKEVYDKLSDDEKKVLDEVIFIRFVNSTVGKGVTITFPVQNSITTSQFEAIKFLGEIIEEVSKKIGKPIKTVVGTFEKHAIEINTFKYKIIPFLEEYIDDDFIQSIPDVNIVATNSLYSFSKKI